MMYFLPGLSLAFCRYIYSLSNCQIFGRYETTTRFVYVFAFIVNVCFLLISQFYYEQQVSMYVETFCKL